MDSSETKYKDYIEIRWTVEDIRDQALEAGIVLDHDQAREILWTIDKDHDSDTGINWGIIDSAIAQLSSWWGRKKRVSDGEYPGYDLNYDLHCLKDQIILQAFFEEVWWDATFYTQEEWKERGEDMCVDSALTLACEGPLLHEMYYAPQDGHSEFRNWFEETCARYGYVVSQGYHWTFHFWRSNNHDNHGSPWVTGPCPFCGNQEADGTSYRPCCSRTRTCPSHGGELLVGKYLGEDIWMNKDRMYWSRDIRSMAWERIEDMLTYIKEHPSG